METLRINVAVLGDGAVGKTAVLDRWRNDHFPEQHCPTVSEIIEERAQRQSRKHGISQLAIQIFDTAGSIAFPAMNRLTILHSDAFIIIYAVDAEKSFERAKQLRNEVNQIKCCERIPCVLVGNKCDRDEDRQVSFDRGLQFAVESKSSFMEASAKTGMNVDDIFVSLWSRYDTLKKIGSKDFLLKKPRRPRFFNFRENWYAKS